MKLLAIACPPAQGLLFSFFLSMFTTRSSAQPPAEKGARIVPAAIPGSYSDGRPTALYRLNATDEGIVLRYGDGPDSCDYLGARDIWVYESKGTYYMNYDGSGPKGWLSCLAISKDLLHWQKKGPVLDYGAPGSPDSRSASYGTTYFDGHKWHMFYLGTPHVSGAPDYIPSFPYLTKKAEGSGPEGPWTKRYDIIPFQAKPGSYYAGAASPGYIIKLGDEYRMFFSASTDTPVIKRGLSFARTKNLDSTWTPDKKPFLPLDEQVENSSVYYEPTNKTWFAFTDHIGLTPGGFEYTDAIWVYWTQDPDHWDPENKAVVLDSTNCTWSKHIIGLPSVVKKGNRLALFYDGHEAAVMPLGSASHVRRDVGLAWLDLPLRLPVKRAVRSSVTSHIKASFLNPPDSTRPGVYWYFMDGNRTKAAMTEDLEAMKKAGIGSVIFLEVNVAVPRGPVNLLSQQWKDLFRHAVREGERLGIGIILGTGPGWAGSGGPWVRPEQSMQHLVSASLWVTGGEKNIVLPLPQPRKPYFGMGTLTPVLKEEWDDFYKDIAVLAFPTPAVDRLIDDIGEKALYYREPYTSKSGVKASLPSLTEYPPVPEGAIIPKDRIIDLTSRLRPDGTLDWVPPAGDWTIVRFGSRNNGAVTRPAPVPGLGFEVDKFDTTSLNAHLDAYIGALLDNVGTLDSKASGGLKRLHIDSWEMGAQNWTPHFREEFIKRRGYDPLPFYPVYAGMIVASLETSERFLWDLRLTGQELILEYHAGQVKKYSHRRGLKLSIEPYDMNPAADLELGNIADIPMCEFWSKGYGFNSSFSCIEATSIAHVNGEPLVPAEAFTAEEQEGWKQYPGSMKNQGDWAFATGINQFMFHTFQHQSLADSLKPGMTMGPYGVHWDRNQTWWPMVGDYHRYVNRCQYVLQQGKAVADILYLTAEGAPQVFRAPASALAGDSILPDRKGYNFDGCAPSQLYAAIVRDGRIVFPGGGAYRLLVLPASRTMTPGLLEKIRWLVKEGATVIGLPPLQSPGLSGFPVCDQQVRTLAGELWGAIDSSASHADQGASQSDGGIQRASHAEQHGYGRGKVLWGGDLRIPPGAVYPEYEATAAVLHAMGVAEDFVSSGPVRYTHRIVEDGDIYFVANRSGEPLTADCIFRCAEGAPELWDPLTGRTRPLTQFSAKQGLTTVALAFDRYQSFFVVFRKNTETTGVASAAGIKNFPAVTGTLALKGPWTVSFDPHWGGPATTVFDTLMDWVSSPVKGIRYYSGIAVYHRNFDLPATLANSGRRRLYIDLGVVKNLARVYLNGKDLGVVWTAPYSVDITGIVQPHGNTLRIEVANLWPNRLIGDEQMPDDGIKDRQWPEWLVKGLPRTSGRYTFTTFKHYNKDSPLLPSGLLGPVTIVQTEF